MQSKSVVAREVGGETLVVPVRSSVGDLASIFSFNSTGTLIWKLLEAPRTLTELSEALAGEYAVESSQAEKDVEEFVGEMKARGLVEVLAPARMAGD